MSETSNEDRITETWVRLESFTDHLDKTTFEGETVGGFSGLTVDEDGLILAISDRSVLFYLDPDTLNPVRVIRLRDELRRKIDCEAVEVDRDAILIATESPEILRYDRSGKLLGVLPMPSMYRVEPIGRCRVNEVFEGMTLVGEHTLVASLEHPLLDDDQDLVRFQVWERPDPAAEFKAAAQHAYPIEPGLMVSDVTATGDGRLLVLERGFDERGNHVSLFLTDVDEADDVSDIEHLRNDAPVLGKRLLIDLADLPPSGAVAKQPQINPLLGNIEAMTVTERAEDGELRLLLATDDNDSPVQITRFYRLRVRLPERG